MTKNNKIYIHLGLHKTGTTFFQKSFYPSHPEFNYKHLRSPEILGDFNQYILREHELTYSLDKAITLFYKNLNKNEVNNKILTLCEEQYSGLPIQDGSNRKIIFDRLNNLFPNANYILVLRNQKDFVRSIYAEYLKKGGTASLYDFLNRKDSTLNFARGSYLRYSIYYEYIKDQVSEERIKVLYYEDFKGQPTWFYKNLLSFFNLNLEIDQKKIQDRKNVSFDKEQFEAIRFYNRIGKTDYGKDHLISPKFQKIITSLYKIIKKTKYDDERIINEFLDYLNLDNSRLPEYNRIKHFGY